RHWRSDTLQKGIRTLLNNALDPDSPGIASNAAAPGAPDSSGNAPAPDSTGNDAEEGDLADKVLRHPLIRQLARSKHGPSYVPSKSFALALFDRISSAPSVVDETIDTLKGKVANMPEGSLKTILASHVNSAGGDIEKARENIEKWFDDSMERVSGWYTRKTRLVGLFLAIIVVVVVNADSLMISNTLAKNDALRDTLVEAASNPDFNEANLKAEVDCKTSPDNINCQIEKAAIPAGWDFPEKFSAPAAEWPSAAERGIPQGLEWVTKVVGLLITAVAVSLGAPFWFRFLGRLMNLRQGLRQSGAPPESSQPRNGNNASG
ncbi:MAG: hypothetical protein ACE5Q6_15775, partial [Dehalococcoidia bacterium]